MNRAILVLAAALAVPALAADPSAPAEFTVTNTVLHPDPGAFTATIGSIPGDRQLFRGGAFEPLVFRTKLRPSGSAPNEIILPAGHWHAYATFRSGFWDGAEVRVYRPKDGKLVKVREDRIAKGGYVATGWQVARETRNQLVAPPGRKKPTTGEDLLDIALEPGLEPVTFQAAIGTTFLPGASYHFCVRAVTSDGRESPPSKPASVTLAAAAKHPAGGRNILVAFKPPRSIPDGPPVPAPTKLAASIDAEGVVSLKWLGVDAKDLAGYRVCVSDVAPAEQRGDHLRLAGKAASEWEHVRRGDVVFLCHQLNNFSRTRHVRGHVWGSGGFSRGAYNLIGAFSDEIPNADWQRVPHPAPLPSDFTDGGETCLQLDLRDDKPFALGMYAFAGTSQTWYPVLQPGKTYVAEGWLRYRGTGQGSVRFRLTGHYGKPAAQGGIDPVDFTAKDEWTHVRTTFSPKTLMESGGVGRFEFEFRGPGTFWADNLRVYAQEPGYLKPDPLVVQRTRESALESIRFHTHIKSGWGQTMAMLTNAPGVIGCRGHSRGNSPFTLPALLDFCRQCRTNPWLQVEMNMSESEWLGLAEYLAAPYDPKTDTPAKKPWAHKRHVQGQSRPWASEFSRITFEISNETWNWMFSPWVFADGGIDAATGETYSRGAMMGLLNEYVISVLETSPYWKGELAEKFRGVIGGWAAESSTRGFGAQAIQHSPSTQCLTIAGYNGGWDEGEKPAEPTDPGFARALTFWLQNEERTRDHLAARDTLLDQGRAHDYEFGTYEAGPGYAMGGLNKQKRMTPEQVEAQDIVGKSLANGVATLDAFLGRAALGFTVQNFFTLNFNRRYWTSHAPVYKGGQPYPSWMGLALFNNHGTGDLLVTETRSAPAADLAAHKRRRARTNAPLVGIYATRKAGRVAVFVLSRKLGRFPDAKDDGFTPVTLHLPFKKARKVALHKITGDPRAHNLDEWAVKAVVKQDIPFAAPFTMTRATTGEASDGMPPGSIFLYVFEGTDAPPANHKPAVAFEARGPVLLGRSVPFRNQTADPDHERVAYAWDFAGAAQSAEREPSHTFTTPGLQRVSLTADDGHGGRATRTRSLDVLLPMGKENWQFRDLWNRGPAATALFNGAGALTMKASGEYRRGDFALAFPPGHARGDLVLSAQIASLEPGETRHVARAGLILCTNFGRWGSRGPAIFATSRGDILFETGGRSSKTRPKPVPGFGVPCWLRLERTGDAVAAFASKTGHDGSWKQVGSARLPATQAVRPGPIVTSGTEKASAQAVFGRVVVRAK